MTGGSHADRVQKGGLLLPPLTDDCCSKLTLTTMRA
jgi:hypothetical protein